MLLAKESHQYCLHDEKEAKRPRKVKKVRCFRNRSGIVYTAILALAFMTFLLLTTRYAQITATGYEIVEMKKQLQLMETENQELEMKIAKLQSLDRIEAVAMGKLGMVNPDTSAGVQFIAVESKGTPEKAALAERSVTDTKPDGYKETHKPIAVIDVVAQMLADFTGKVAHAETGTVAE